MNVERYFPPSGAGFVFQKETITSKTQRASMVLYPALAILLSLGTVLIFKKDEMYHTFLVGLKGEGYKIVNLTQMIQDIKNSIKGEISEDKLKTALKADKKFMQLITSLYLDKAVLKDTKQEILTLKDSKREVILDKKDIDIVESILLESLTEDIQKVKGFDVYNNDLKIQKNSAQEVSEQEGPTEAFFHDAKRRDTEINGEKFNWIDKENDDLSNTQIFTLFNKIKNLFKSDEPDIQKKAAFISLLSTQTAIAHIHEKLDMQLTESKEWSPSGLNADGLYKISISSTYNDSIKITHKFPRLILNATDPEIIEGMKFVIVEISVKEGPELNNFLKKLNFRILSDNVAEENALLGNAECVTYEIITSPLIHLKEGTNEEKKKEVKFLFKEYS